MRHYGYRNPFCYDILKVCYLFLKQLGMGLGPTSGSYPKWRRRLVCAKSVVNRSSVSLGLLY